MENSTLTPAQLRYLVTIDRLHKERRPLRVTTIASDLGLARSSVHNMLDCFIDLGLLTRSEKGVCRLTEDGEKTVRSVSASYDAAVRILRSQFPAVRDPSEAAFLLISKQEHRP